MLLAATESSGLGSQLTMLLPLLLIAGMMFLMFRSRKKQMAQQSAMVTSLVPGVRVLLGSGFFGTIQRVEGDRADIEIAPGVVTTVLTRSILRVDNGDQQTAGDDLIGRERGDEPPASPIDER
ncbi:preprotein translocase subunit YajC [Cumulibacter manganitolerans]|uniref:preprotein translocase subunit YajC n=1 Tax=Cumulibacter manganitolerans TaxID=1884992 RepID=UPI0012965BD6|nr:preprotein translocase subunit YajC [Cumulibacter manganitolerans]